MTRVLTKQRLERENLAYRFTGGISQENRGLGFRPAFRDAEDGAVYLSLRACGSPAPFHCLEGLPPVLVVGRDAAGVPILKPSLEAGFVREGRFYTRDEAAATMAAGDD